jgi:hypothetical protein
MRNIQHRVIKAPADALGVLLDRFASAEDLLWPAAAWFPVVLDSGLTPGSSGGHGPIRYSVSSYQPGRRIRFDFAPDLGINGYHELVITEEGPASCRLTHTISAGLSGRMVLLWPLVIRWLHEALLQDLLDNAEVAVTGRLARPRARWSWWVRLLRSVKGLPRSRQPIPADPGHRSR